MVQAYVARHNESNPVWGPGMDIKVIVVWKWDLDKDKYVAAILMDISKAFERLPTPTETLKNPMVLWNIF